ncbi:MAG: hypothetical protein R2828_24545 [Saprospiraceae bacterium]
MQNIKLILIALTLCFTSQVLAQAPCSTPAHRQFDFWVGDWDVYATAGDTIVGYNTINSILGGCVVEENWTGGTGFQGKSFNTYNPQDSTWNQVWVDMGGATYHFKGKYNDKVMQMKGESLGRNGQKILFDMSYHPQADGAVRQIWKMSRDNGENWTIAFDGMYRKKKD